MGRKHSIVWKHFQKSETESSVTCNHCQSTLSRGDNKNKYSTSGMFRHLNRCKEFKNIGKFTSSKSLPSDLYDSCASDGKEVDSNINSNDIEPFDSQYGPSFAPPVSSFVTDYDALNGRTTPSFEEMEENAVFANNELAMSPVVEGQTFTTLDDYPPPGGGVNLQYGGLLLGEFYEQYKNELFCDLKLVMRNSGTGEVVISETGELVQDDFRMVKDKVEVKVHSCLLAAVSKKIQSLVLMGCNSIQLKRGSPRAIRSLVEIVYTGKLSKISTFSSDEIRDIHEVAKFLEILVVMRYLLSERPDVQNVDNSSKVCQTGTSSRSEEVNNPRPENQKIHPRKRKTLNSIFPLRRSGTANVVNDGYLDIILPNTNGEENLEEAKRRKVEIVNVFTVKKEA